MVRGPNGPGSDGPMARGPKSCGRPWEVKLRRSVRDNQGVLWMSDNRRHQGVNDVPRTKYLRRSEANREDPRWPVIGRPKDSLKRSPYDDQLGRVSSGRRVKHTRRDYLLVGHAR